MKTFKLAKIKKPKLIKKYKQGYQAEKALFEKYGDEDDYIVKETKQFVYVYKK